MKCSTIKKVFRKPGFRLEGRSVLQSVAPGICDVVLPLPRNEVGERTENARLDNFLSSRYSVQAVIIRTIFHSQNRNIAEKACESDLVNHNHSARYRYQTDHMPPGTMPRQVYDTPWHAPRSPTIRRKNIDGRELAVPTKSHSIGPVRKRVCNDLRHKRDEYPYKTFLRHLCPSLYHVCLGS